MHIDFDFGNNCVQRVPSGVAEKLKFFEWTTFPTVDVGFVVLGKFNGQWYTLDGVLRMLSQAAPPTHKTQNKCSEFVSMTKDTHSCWLWTASVSESGYPRIRNGKKIVYARPLFFDAIGIYDAPSKNKCKNKLCVRPSHFVRTCTEKVQASSKLVQLQQPHAGRRL